MKKTRRTFLKSSGIVAGAGLLGLYGCGQEKPADQHENAETGAGEPETDNALFFEISLAQWSLHRMILDRKELDNLDYPAFAKEQFGINAVEYVSRSFADKVTDPGYLRELNNRAQGEGVKNLLIMVDDEGPLADTDDKIRNQSVENHYKWIEAASVLGCHSIRVNAYSSDSDMKKAAYAAIDGLGKLATYAREQGINVIVENHGGYSSNGQWLSTVMKEVGMDNCGTLPDFGNFCLSRNEEGSCLEEYDRYKGVAELMPYAKGVSAKSHDFDKDGNEVHTDYRKMLAIVKKAGYTGYIGIEYEGSNLSEVEGIRLTKELLEKVGREMQG